MRSLVIFRGSMGSGKSYFLKENNLEQYALCPDQIRLLFQTPVMTPDGSFAISQKNDKKVWDLLFTLLEERMIRGEFTIIDAVHAKSRDFKKYKELAQKYKYRVYCVDFTNVPIEVAKERNKMRPDYKRVPESAIENAYSRFEIFEPQSWVETIKPEDFINKFYMFKPLDFTNQYKKIHHIGDIHGCFEPLKEYFKYGLKDDEMYIFVGDFVDRGIQNSEVMNFILSIYDKPNVMLLEGNHERHLLDWANGKMAVSNEFECVTRPELERGNIDKKLIRMFHRKLIQMAFYQFNDKYVVVTHGGISRFPFVNSDVYANMFQFIASSQFIKGVGRYEDAKLCDESFNNSVENQNIYSIHGHRNVENLPIKVNDCCFNLEGQVEFGGNLRIVTLDEKGFELIEIKNNTFKERNFKNREIKLNNEEFLRALRDNVKAINEKKLDDNISSFNFKRDVFYDKTWDTLNIKARGLFINTITGDIVSRSYDKFFNINERRETELQSLEKRFAYPLKAYVKENGFLGLIGYDALSDKVIYSSKSTNYGDFTAYFRNIFSKSVNYNNDFEIKLKNYLKENNVTFVFEVIDVKNDPHIIEYDFDKIVLLDIIKRQPNFEKLSYEDMVKVAQDFRFLYKKLGYTINSWQEFLTWYDNIMKEDYKYNNQYIEGFVIEDANGFMVKTKLSFYKCWKYLRNIKDKVEKGRAHMVNQASLNKPILNKFFGWLKTQDQATLQKGIIELRKKFEGELNEKV